MLVKFVFVFTMEIVMGRGKLYIKMQENKEMEEKINVSDISAVSINQGKVFRFFPI